MWTANVKEIRNVLYAYVIFGSLQVCEPFRVQHEHANVCGTGEYQQAPTDYQHWARC